MSLSCFRCSIDGQLHLEVCVICTMFCRSATLQARQDLLQEWLQLHCTDTASWLQGAGAVMTGGSTSIFS